MRHTSEKVKIIQFTKLRQFYIPADADSYRTLHRLRLPAIRYHEDFFPTIQLLTQKHSIRAQLKPFSEIYDEFMAQVTESWEKNPKRKVVVLKGGLRLESRDPSGSRLVFPKVEQCLRRFYRRWGFNSEFEYSESPTRSKLVVSYSHDKDKLPVIEFIKT